MNISSNVVDLRVLYIADVILILEKNDAHYTQIV